jgi:hypothetical protein
VLRIRSCSDGRVSRERAAVFCEVIMEEVTVKTMGQEWSWVYVITAQETVPSKRQL